MDMNLVAFFSLGAQDIEATFIQLSSHSVILGIFIVG